VIVLYFYMAVLILRIFIQAVASSARRSFLRVSRILAQAVNEFSLDSLTLEAT